MGVSSVNDAFLYFGIFQESRESDHVNFSNVYSFPITIQRCVKCCDYLVAWKCSLSEYIVGANIETVAVNTSQRNYI